MERKMYAFQSLVISYVELKNRMKTLEENVVSKSHINFHVYIPTSIVIIILAKSQYFPLVSTF